MKQLFQQIEELIPTLPGWGDANKAQTLAALVIALRPTVSVEIGVYGGRTFFGLALAHKFIGKGRVIGIDPWSNAAAVEGYEGENRRFWQENPLNQIYNDFLKKILELSVGNVSAVVRARSDDVGGSILPGPIDILHVDGQHTEQAVRDVDRYAKLVRIGGVVVMDDTGWTNGDDAPVRRAVEFLKSFGFVSLYPLGTGEVFQRIR